MVPKQTFVCNALNFLLMIIVAAPAFYFQFFLYHECSHAYRPVNPPNYNNSTFEWFPLHSLDKASICSFGMNNPMWTVNVLFFLNVCVLFWILSLIQRSTWLIDPYWTIIPVLIAHFYASHPLAKSDPLRSNISLILVWIWSIRLTHSYFRREEWQFGAREDWRFTELQKDHPTHWWWMSFFLAYASQQFMLVGITFPFYAINSSAKPFDPIFDTIATVCCVAGLLMAYFADTQLREFTVANEQRVKEGKAKVLVLNSGIWYYSRRPNYFGEQLWWWGIALYACNVGQYWMIIGTLINSLCLAQVTLMVEKKMLANKDRAEAYKEYMATTSVWVPWFKSSLPKKKTL